MKKTPLLLLATPLVALSLMWTDLARADALPPNACTTAGAPCTNAPSSSGGYSGAGTCEHQTCSHPLPDGGSTSYDCYMCVATDGGTSTDAGPTTQDSGVTTTPVPPTDGGGTTDAGGSSSSGGSGTGGGGCSLGAVSPENAAPALVLLLGLALLAPRRKR